MATEYTKLASSVLNQKLLDPNQDPKTPKEHLKFEKLPLVNKNIIKMLQFIDGQDQFDIDMFAPSDNFLQMINQASPAGVRALFKHEFDSAGLLGNVPLGLSTTIKNGALISFPSPSTLTGLCVFFCHPTGIEETSVDEILRIQEQASHSKLQRDDIELMTKCKPFTPYNFSSFQHMLKTLPSYVSTSGGHIVYQPLPGSLHCNTPQ